MIGLCTENYLVPDCCDQSPAEGCGVGPAPALCHTQAAAVAALSPSKAPGESSQSCCCAWVARPSPEPVHLSLQ